MGSRAEVDSSIRRTSGFVGQGRGNAQPLLLAAGEAQGALLQTVLDLVPNGGVPEGFLHDGVQIRAVADAVGPGP